MKIAVSGAAGRMGRRIIALAYDNHDIEISAALETDSNPLIGQDVGSVAGIGSIGIPISNNVDDVVSNSDVLIDFSSPEATIEHLRVVNKAGKAIVIGTTGLSEEQRLEVTHLARTTKCLMAPNMSLGVNLLFNLVEKVAKALGDNYDVEIVESHHNQKKDAPSGTANKLAEIIASSLNRDLNQVGVYGRHGIIGARKPSEIGVMALRGGDIVGEHTVMFVTGGERLELIHRAHSRDSFAKGAIQAALWIYDKPAGLYDMRDVLGLRD